MGSPLVSGSRHSRLFAILALSATIISTSASLIMLWLIIKMKKWNGHLLLITTMTAFQTLYDISFYSAMVDVHNVYVTVSSNVAQIVGGMASAFLSNVIAGLAFYVILYRQSFPIFKAYPYILVFVLLVTGVAALLFLLSVTVEDKEYLADISVLYVYFYARLVSIGINFVFALLTMLQIRRTRSGKETMSHVEKVINRLSLRLFYYPIVQAISRSGCAWYEMRYGYNFDPNSGYNFSPEHTSNFAFAAQCTMALSMPVASIGYLIIFLIMQPKAFYSFVHILDKPPTQDLSVLLLNGGERTESDTDSDYEDAVSMHSIISDL
jgi:hypothetical protein